MAPSSCTHTRSSSKFHNSSGDDYDLTATETRHERRKIQNRLNQRAHRLRAQDRKISNSGQPYRVHRWRVDNGKDGIPCIKPRKSPSSSARVPETDNSAAAPSNQLVVSRNPESGSDSNPHRALVSVSTTVPNRSPAPWLGLNYCLLSDHLLHLIHFNVLRGLSYNKKVIQPNAFIECTGSATAQLKRILPQLPEPGPLLELRLPESLTPTKLQMSCPHSNWIDVFPFPKMRDNLIRWEDYFSHAEFLTDLLGSLISCMTAPPPKTTHALLSSREQSTAQVDGDDVPSDRRGLILWGEPFHKDSWEVTPGFLRKWSWAVEGCGELLDSTNRWRTARGETPLRIAVMSR